MPAHHVSITALFRDSRITEIEDLQTNSLTAYAQYGMLYVSGLTPGKLFRVYNVSGMLVYQGVAGSEKAELTLPGRGIYIVNDGNVTVKVSN